MRRHPGLKSIAVALGCVLACLASPGLANDTVFFVVRHAEKLDESTDPELSPQGHKRAEQLMQTLEHLRVDGTYHTQFARTKQTADPLAMKRTIPMTMYVADDLNWLNGVLVAQKGKRLLVVGHSNTIGEIVKHLSGQPAPSIGDEYDNLFIVTIPETGAKSVVRLKYGEAP